MSTTLDDKLDTREVPLHEYMETAYLAYAAMTVKSRALPQTADGQKPVQRRILYAMRGMGLSATAKPVKSAKVVGQVLGVYHPHGDSSVYDAAVRLAQPFSMRYPLIDGQGNFGSRDGSPPAAMRYTEMRLTKYADLLLSELDEGTVAFGKTYDNSEEEPKQLPDRLPLLLANGASGIAVGLATEIPPHNLREAALAAVAYLNNPGVSLDEIMGILPAPDFPSGGQIVSPVNAIRQAYAAGRGSVRVRGRYQYEDLARGQWRIVFTELPHGTSAALIMEEVDACMNPKIAAGKKAITQEQAQVKALFAAMLDEMRNEAGRDVDTRLVFEPKNAKIDKTDFLAMLLSHTSLETSVPINLVAVDLTGTPRPVSLLEMISDWCEFRLRTVENRTRHRLGKAQDRHHILEGRQIVFLHVDAVIRVIREADDPKAELMQAFSLSERQAEDILEIRLRQLARLEGIKIAQEITELEQRMAGFQALLNDPVKLRALTVKEIEADAKSYGDPRRTLIEEAHSVAFVAGAALDEPITVYLSTSGWIKAKAGHGQDPSTAGFKAGTRIQHTVECSTASTLVVLTAEGRVYNLAGAQIPTGRGDGVPLTALLTLPPKTEIIQILVQADAPVLVTGTHGYGFSCNLQDLSVRGKAGKQFVTLSPEERVLPVVPVSAPYLALATTDGYLLTMPMDHVKPSPSGGKGLQLIKLAEGARLLQALPVRPGAPITLFLEGRETGRSYPLAEMEGKRATRGTRVVQPGEQLVNIA